MTENGAFVTTGSSGGPDVLAFRYNPASMRRLLQHQAGEEAGDRSQEVRFSGPPAPAVIIEMEIELGTGDSVPSGNPVAIDHGVLRQIAALELLVHLSLSQIEEAHSPLRSSNTSPLSGPRTLLQWGDKRSVPVRVTSSRIVEMIGDVQGKPALAIVAVAMQELTYLDVTSAHR